MKVKKRLVWAQVEKRLSMDDIFKPGYESALRQQLGNVKKWPDFYMTSTHLVFWSPFKDETPAPVAVPLKSMQRWLKA